MNETFTRRHPLRSINYMEIGQRIAAETIDELPLLYAAARREDRRELLFAAVNQIMSTGVDAEAPTAVEQRAQLKRLGEKFPQLVLNGTFQQQFACKLATWLALPREIPLPASVMTNVIAPLTDALIAVLRVGAPATRDAAVEGLGGLLKLFPEPAMRFPALPRLEVQREKEETDETFNDRKRISDEYFDRLERRHLMVLTIANDVPSCAEFADHLKEPITARVAGLLAMSEVPWKKVEDVLYSYPDLLRILPAVARQNSAISLNSAGLLYDAARLARIDAGAPEWVTLAFARFQENVFRTIDTALRRCDWDWPDLDEALSTAIRALPRGIDGTPSVCNARIRATVAVVRTATRLITSGSGVSSTKAALKDLFSNIGAAAPWMNLGIIESAYRVLPDLLPHSEHDDLTEPMLQWLIRQFSRPHNVDDLVEVHRHLIANSCFRRIVAAALDSTDSSNHNAAENAVRKLLSEPTTENVFRLRRRIGGLHSTTDQKPSGIAPAVIAGIVFESELLARTSTIFKRWEHATAFEKVLLARILALQLHTLARDTRELERHSVLQRLFSNTAKGPTNRDADDLAWELLSSLPAEAADPADAEIQRFVEFRGESGDATATALPGYVLAMISTTISDRIAGSIAREVDLHLRSDRSQAHAGDFARLLYQVTLRGPHESIFDHLLPRIRDEHERATVSLFRRHVARLRRDAENTDPDLRRIIGHFKLFSEDLDGHPATRGSETLLALREALRTFTDLTQTSKDVWRALAADRTLELINSLDALAGENAHRAPLATFKKRLTDLQDEVIHYLALPVGRFEERQNTLSRMIDAVGRIESSIRVHRGLQPPEQMLLIALFRSQQVLFDGTRRWFCDEARKLKERNDRHRFWLYFCDPRPGDERVAAFSELEKPALSITTLYNLAHVRAQIDSAPPGFPAQRAKFEEFFVDWMTSELDVETLKKVLRERWPPFFRCIYAVTTSFWLMSLTMLAPFALALWLDYRGHHEWEGIGFFVIALAMLLAALFSLTPPLISGFLGKLSRGKRAGPGYWFPCLLPRLARLTAVPMALIVEFDHSYEFPLHASSASLLFLASLSLITTRFFVTRELVGQEEQSHITSDESKRVWQIVAVALAHSFAIAVVLSTIFASGHDVKTEGNDLQPSVQVDAGKPTPFWMLVETVLEEVDNKHAGEKYPRFLGLVPRVVSVDFGAIAQNLGHPLPAKVAEHVKFQSYPTIILVWTALGLFFGVFLEGFMKGERLRGLTIDTPTEDNPSD